MDVLLASLTPTTSSYVGTSHPGATTMTGEIPYYGTTGAELWKEFAQMAQEWANKNAVRVEISEISGAWTGISFPGRGRVLQVRVNANSLRCYPLGVEPSERFGAVEHEPSKCSKSWKRRFPSMFTLEGPEQLPLAFDLVTELLAKLHMEEPVLTITQTVMAAAAMQQAT